MVVVMIVVVRMIGLSIPIPIHQKLIMIQISLLFFLFLLLPLLDRVRRCLRRLTKHSRPFPPLSSLRWNHYRSLFSLIPPTQRMLSIAICIIPIVFSYHIPVINDFSTIRRGLINILTYCTGISDGIALNTVRGLCQTNPITKPHLQGPSVGINEKSKSVRTFLFEQKISDRWPGR